MCWKLGRNFASDSMESPEFIGNQNFDLRRNFPTIFHLYEGYGLDVVDFKAAPCRKSSVW